MGFGLWASGNEWNTQQLVMQQMDRHQEENIPVSVVVIEAWSDEEGFTIFRDAQYQPTGDASSTVVTSHILMTVRGRILKR